MDYTLGCRADPDYSKQLPLQIVRAIELAAQDLTAVQVGSTAVDAGQLTKNRRWITRPDTLQSDPFGERTVRAMMHPGHQNPDFTGPSGPVDPWLSVLSFQTHDGKSLAVLANYSMHYFGGHPGISSDYFGLFCRRLSDQIAPGDKDHLTIMSQGTSGDLWWGDYSRPREQRSISDFTDQLVALATTAQDQVEHRMDCDLEMVERRIKLARRAPNPDRLAWAKRKLQLMGDRRPQDRPEVYAEQAVYLDGHPDEQIVLQAIRIGGIGITAIPNEVYAITGLKLKAQSPLSSTFNIELANGAAGYIPPPEQHALGGYTTWPARTAGLAVDAEPTIVEALLEMLEEVSGKERVRLSEPTTAYSQRVFAFRPYRFWRMGEMEGSTAIDSSAASAEAKYVGMMALGLPGIDSHQPAIGTSRATHFAGGHIEADGLELETPYSLSLWCYLAVPTDWREITGVLVDCGKQTLQVTGSADDQPGRLQIGSTVGSTTLESGQWYHVVLVQDDHRLVCYLDGREEFSAEVGLTSNSPRRILFGASAQPNCSWEGKLDEIAVFRRALDRSQVADLFASASERLVGDKRSDDSVAVVERGAIPDLPPLSPAASMQQTMIRDGYTLQLVAAEPLVADPVAIDWDLSGRLWVVEMADYPYGMDGQGQPGGRVRCLEDLNSDGQYERSTVFLDGLSFPTAVMPWRDGVLITAAPELIFAKDTDGDGRADVRHTLFQGFMEGNQQLRVNGLRFGLDNWVYCANGGHHAGFGASNSIRVVETGQSIALGSRDFRFRPDTGEIHPQTGPSQFGRVRDDWGRWFGVQNSYPLWHYVLQDHYLRRNAAVPYSDTRKQLRPPANPPVYSAKPPQKRYHSFENSGHYTSACGPCIYRDDLLFSSDKVTHAFTCEPFHNLVQHHVLSDEGVSFQGKRAPSAQPHDFFASADRWCRPVMARTGPDGALWIVDMYRYMIEHPDWLPEEGRKELEPYYRAGESKGRIYRIFPTDKSIPRMPVVKDGCTTRDLVAQLASPNGVVRDKVQARLVSTERRDAIPLLRTMLAENQDPRARLHALATLDGLCKASSQDLKLALSDPHPGVRCLALKVVEASSLAPDLVAAATELQADSDSRVKLQLAFTLGELDGAAASEALAAMMKTTHDPHVISALISSLPRHFETAVDVLVENDSVNLRFWDAAFRMSTQRPEQLGRLAEHILPKNTVEPSNRQISLATQWLSIIDEQGVSVSQIRHAHPHAMKPLGRLEAMFDAAWQVATTADHPLDERVQAIRLIRYDPRPVADYEEQLTNLLRPDQPFKVQVAAIDRLAVQVDQAAAELLLAPWPTYSPDMQRVVLDRLLGKSIGAEAILSAIESKLIRPVELDAARREQLTQHQDPAVAKRAASVLRDVTNSDRRDAINRFRESLTLTGRAEHGGRLFTKLCANCHGADENTRIGPQLHSLTDRSSRSLLTAILDPSAAVEPRYLGYNIQLKSGQTVHGVIVAESGASLELRLLDGTRKRIVRSSIEFLQSTRQSFMPNGLELELTPQSLADVMAYVQSL